jgi:hypothetical protein
MSKSPNPNLENMSISQLIDYSTFMMEIWTTICTLPCVSISHSFPMYTIYRWVESDWNFFLYFSNISP